MTAYTDRFSRQFMPFCLRRQLVFVGIGVMFKCSCINLPRSPLQRYRLLRQASKFATWKCSSPSSTTLTMTLSNGFVTSAVRDSTRPDANYLYPGSLSSIYPRQDSVAHQITQKVRIRSSALSSYHLYELAYYHRLVNRCHECGGRSCQSYNRYE